MVLINGSCEQTIPVRVVTYATPNSSFLRQDATGGLEGVCVEIWRKIAEELKPIYTIESVEPDSSIPVQNIPWNSLFKRLNDGSPDIVIHHFMPGIARYDQE